MGAAMQQWKRGLGHRHHDEQPTGTSVCSIRLRNPQCDPWCSRRLLWVQRPRMACARVEQLRGRHAAGADGFLRCRLLITEESESRYEGREEPMTYDAALEMLRDGEDYGND